MKRYFSHYTVIYPEIYLKNYIVEMDMDKKIIRIFPYSQEIEKTEFYSGTLIFMPEEKMTDSNSLSFAKDQSWDSSISSLVLTEKYNVWHKDSMSATAINIG